MHSNTYTIRRKSLDSYYRYLSSLEYTCVVESGITETALPDEPDSGSKNAQNHCPEHQSLSGVPSKQFDREMLGGGICTLGPDFSPAMGGVLVLYELLREDMQPGIKLVQTSVSNRINASKHFSEALNRYRQACREPHSREAITEAAEHLQLSIRIFDLNPVAHLLLGHIFHYREEFRNTKRALDHYRRCYTFCEAWDELKPLGAQAYFYAGWLQAVALQDIEEAIRLTRRALELDPALGEALYHLAKLYAADQAAEKAAACLQKAIMAHDRRYAVKAAADADFDEMREHVRSLYRDCIRTDIQSLQATLKKYKTVLRDDGVWSSEKELARTLKLITSGEPVQYEKLLTYHTVLEGTLENEYAKRLAASRSATASRPNTAQPAGNETDCRAEKQATPPCTGAPRPLPGSHDGNTFYVRLIVGGILLWLSVLAVFCMPGPACVVTMLLSIFTLPKRGYGLLFLRHDSQQ